MTNVCDETGIRFICIACELCKKNMINIYSKNNKYFFDLKTSQINKNIKKLMPLRISNNVIVSMYNTFTILVRSNGMGNFIDFPLANRKISSAKIHVSAACT